MKNFQLQEAEREIMTSGKEDYLKAIYIISEDHELVSNKELSDMLHVSPPSVSEMIMKLQKEGYVDYTAYKGSKMTRKGRREAGKLFRFHALWEGSISPGAKLMSRRMVWNTRRATCLRNGLMSFSDILNTVPMVTLFRRQTAAAKGLLSVRFPI